ncbi:Plasmodium exported protein, unknown function [Plasmodium malariae]|uniref:Fam-h protein n=1 Tax=Plasmodium malariae TaxID=5858 RepID=A0A1D3JJ70_PLAMA|nr:Plasmodium exported protein, unknown function [Plasmodium malariae]SBT86425.1 Plasmodium exported protein, unknown function [Plasmodium malariae]
MIFIKISVFIFLTWTYNFRSNVNKFIKYLDEYYIFGRYLDTGTYRLLAKYERNKNSNFVELEIVSPCDEGYKKKCKSCSENITKTKNKQLNSNSLNNEGVCEEIKKSNITDYSEDDAYFDKKTLNRKYYLKIARDIRNTDYMNLWAKSNHKHKLIFILPTFLLLAGILIYIFERYFIFALCFESISAKWWPTASVSIILFLILTFTVLPAFFYNLKKSVKYNKLVHIKCKMNKSKYDIFPE